MYLLFVSFQKLNISGQEPVKIILRRIVNEDNIWPYLNFIVDCKNQKIYGICNESI